MCLKVIEQLFRKLGKMPRVFRKVISSGDKCSRWGEIIEKSASCTDFADALTLDVLDVAGVVNGIS
jgi:hypothetical protein